MKIRSLAIKDFYVPAKILGNDEAPEKEKVKINYTRRPSAGEIGTYSKSYYKDDLLFRDRNDNKAVLDFVSSIENLEVECKAGVVKKIETAEDLINSTISLFSTLITMIANDLLIPDDYELGEEEPSK